MKHERQVDDLGLKHCRSRRPVGSGGALAAAHPVGTRTTPRGENLRFRLPAEAGVLKTLYATYQAALRARRRKFENLLESSRPVNWETNLSTVSWEAVYPERPAGTA